MAFNPSSNVILTYNPMSDYKNIILFNNASSQEAYFKSRKIKDELTDFSYVRKDNALVVPFHIDELWNCNYVMYNNDQFKNKWFYAYVTKKEYVNSNVTKLYLKTDVFQTWYFNINIQHSFVVREHVSNDTIGANTVPENLDVGEVVCQNTVEDIALSEYFWIAVSSSWNPEGSGEQFAGITVYNKQVFGKQIFLFRINDITDYKNLLIFITKCNMDGHIDDIDNIFIVPSALVIERNLSQHTCSFTSPSDHPVTFTATYYSLQYSNDVVTFNQNIPKITSFSGYTPKNNKCFVYPYNYLLVSNNSGNHNIYKYEDFSNSSNATFEVQLALEVGVSGRSVPKNYKGMSSCDDEAIPLGKYPTCSWSSDSYTNWLTQNAINMPTKIASTIISTAVSIPTGNAISIANSASSIAGIIGEFYEASLLPNIESGQNTGNVNFSANRNTFSYRQMHSKIEYLRIIDDYFSKYGYKINRVKKPLLNSRRYWNYIETIDVNISGGIPMEDMNEIKEIFNNGVTLWHDTNHLLDYSQSNSIVS